MQKLIKHIRDYLGLSQADFAEKLGVNFATVNRWENGRAVPTKLAQAKLYDYCKEQSVPVYQFVLDKIASEVAEVKLEDGRILLYHGSKSGIVGDIAPKSREMCDFGKGFYMGTEPGQPLTLNMHMNHGIHITLPDRKVQMYERDFEPYIKSFAAFIVSIYSLLEIFL